LQSTKRSSGNRILTPLEIPDFKELPSGSTKNKESIDFVVTRDKDKADDLLIEVFDGATLLFSDVNTSGLLSGGDWQWDGYDTSGILDTKVLKSKNLKVRLEQLQLKSKKCGAARREICFQRRWDSMRSWYRRHSFRLAFGKPPSSGRKALSGLSEGGGALRAA
jgi:hypothetical protein